MADIQKYSLIPELKMKDEQLKGSPSVLGMTALTFPNYINSMRSTMFTAHLKQYLNLLTPDFPLVFTNNENMVGKYSSGYTKVKHKSKVIRKVCKYDDILDVPRIFMLFIFDEETQTYDVIERKMCESLTENFGYNFNNSDIDSIQEGDTIDPGSVLIRSTSYDEDMNYAYGENTIVAYTLDPFTSEDAAVISKSFASRSKSIETETITIGINRNDYLVNLYGDKKHYKPLPDIGDVASDILVASRRLFKNQILFDFKDSSLLQIHDSDILYYIDKDAEIIDIEIYNNSDERFDSPFYEQINKYLDSQMRYYKQIVEVCDEIKASGYEYTQKLDYVYSRARLMIDTEKKWKNDDTEFGNMEIKITYRRISPLAKGSKITGRSGNKSVVSLILDDDEMPYTEDGRRIDVMLNLLAIINRTTAAPLYEMLINGASFQIRQEMKKKATLEEKEELLFDYINIFNEDQSANMHDDYRKMKKKEKEEYIQSAIDDGIYIHWNPMWEKVPIFYRCQNLFKKYPFIKPVSLYVNKWGRKIKILNDYFVGEMYLMKLKQSDRRGFSARSTGALDIKSLPTRSFKKKAHQERISSSCIRFKSLNPYIVIYRSNLVNCWELQLS